ncbi:MAG TPA: D-alanyl-D-alanine carboxypeptidase/D-alanyl-D-alanine-endopeptidase [Chthonomonadales bacterium]|nr:D-alanyl-D-alanine carboxypeptidase/D-alanyl-D-alanine-endopeptidase [Chthonomonadales bacterium]
MTRFRTGLALLLLLAATVARAQHPRPDVAEAFEEALRAPELKGGVQGIVVESLEDGSVWYERNRDLFLIPASNQKLLTSAAALALLGPGWRFHTEVLRAAGGLGAGVLRGPLWLRGGGDPTLDIAHLDRLARAVRQAGIVHITGGLVADDSLFDAQRHGDGWSWNYLSEHYAAPVSALSLAGNVLRVTKSPGRSAGDPVRARIEPAASGVPVVVRARTAPAGARRTIRATRQLGRSLVVVEGLLPLDATPDARPALVAVEDPARFAAHVFVDRLRRAGVRVEGGVRLGKTPAAARPVAVHASEPLGDLLHRMNKPSDNLFAECLFRILGARRSGVGSFRAARGAVRSWLDSVGVPAAEIDMTDGSGLSRLNGVTAGALARLLHVMHARPEAAAWIASLPVAGVDGTLRNRMRGTPAAGNLRAKTGYVGYVSALSGYVSTADGVPLVLVILMNHHRTTNAVARGIQDRLVAYLAAYRSPSPQGGAQ